LVPPPTKRDARSLLGLMRDLYAASGGHIDNVDELRKRA
jgi:hypothetical protein